MSPSNFASELASALKENSFGLKEYQVVRETLLESIATVILLEGHTITVSLSPRGFEVGHLTAYLFLILTHDRENQVLDTETGVVHETLEQLLDSQSPAYRLASQQALFSRLDGFANTRTDEGSHLAGSTAHDGL
jgi:hypothetical protein